jgi:hypothetical protein
VSRERLATIFFLSALVLAPASFLLVLAYAGPEPFFEYQRIDALGHIGVSTAAIALWLVWSLGVLGLIAARIFSVGWLGGLLVAATCVFYLTLCPSGYLDDLENFMLSPEQQQRIKLPEHKS